MVRASGRHLLVPCGLARGNALFSFRKSSRQTPRLVIALARPVVYVLDGGTRGISDWFGMLARRKVVNSCRSRRGCSKALEQEEPNFPCGPGGRGVFPIRCGRYFPRSR